MGKEWRAGTYFCEAPQALGLPARLLATPVFPHSPIFTKMKHRSNRSLLHFLLSAIGVTVFALSLQAQMKSVDFPDTMRFEPLKVISKAKRLPRSLPPFHYRLDSLVQEDRTLFSNDSHQMEFTFWMPVGKKWKAFQLNSHLQFNDKVTVTADEVTLQGQTYYHIEFWGEDSPAKHPDGGLAECATVAWIDPRAMKALDFTRYRNETWANGVDEEGNVAFGNTTEEASFSFEGNRIHIVFERQRFTPEPNYHNAMFNWTYVFRQEPLGWIKESETSE